MKVGILAGGVGSRLSEETHLKPKPMVEIGGLPILWHIMMHYACYGYRDFVIALGYKGEYIKKWMIDYCQISSADLSIDLRSGLVHQNGHTRPDWRVELVDTGISTGTGGRIKRLIPHLSEDGGSFFVTWGDGVSNIDLNQLLAFHRSHGKLATLTAVRPPARFGHLELDNGQVVAFTEKPQAGEGWINGAYFVLEPGVADYIADDETMFEREPLENLARDGQLMAYRHEDFWHCMDTLRDKKRLEDLWESNQAPWRIWS